METIKEDLNVEEFEYTLENKQGKKFRVKVHREVIEKEIKENLLETF